MAIHILGIRHHGPGSAKNVKAFLEKTQPDIVLVEGPPEADGILQWVSQKELKPPVAILCFQPDNPQQSAFYPFAEYSPEWQAILYARVNNIPVKFMDLPAAHQFAIDEAKRKAEAAAETNNAPRDENENDIISNTSLLKSAKQNNRSADGTKKLSNVMWYKSAMPSQHTNLSRHKLPLKHGQQTSRPANKKIFSAAQDDETATQTPALYNDPILHLAEAAGFTDGEKWWEHMFEHRHNDEEIFTAVNEAMQALRETLPGREDEREQQREAYMRKTIRQAEREMYQNIAVVCGAWHAPALLQMPPQKADNDLLKNLSKVKVECTWIPWTYSRLSFFSGYGAGIFSPGWYGHLWKYPTDDGTRWMAKVAKLLRQKNMDISVAHVIEAVRLAASLASLRNLSRPGLEEFNEATLSVLFNGEPIMMQLVQKELIVSNKIGTVPTEIPKPPLQLDIERQQKKLRLPATADWKDYVLDLRKETDLQRSIFLHRLLLLGIKWGATSNVNSKGTFKEQWRLQWDPAFSIDIIEKGTWGNTAEEAASKYVIHQSAETNDLPQVCQWLEQCIPAELPTAVETLVLQINNLAATGADVLQLMQALPGLVNITRYGNVRKTDAALVNEIVNGIITRVCVSLPAACTGIDEEAALQQLDLFIKMNDAVNTLQQPTITQQWQQTVSTIAHNANTAPAIGGYTTRLLADYKIIEGDELVKLFYYAMSAAAAPAIAAAWLEGFLKGSGTILLVDDDLWNVVNNWVQQLDEEIFTQVLPLLRRTFSTFSKPEKRKLGEKVKFGNSSAAPKIENGIDEERAAEGIAVMMKLFGYNTE